MSQQENPRQEHPSTYFVQDRESQDELIRLHLQDLMITTGMGGVLPEQPDPTTFRRIADVGCGTGDWLIETAKTYPGISLLVGIDISGKMIEYARAGAAAQGVSDRVEFHIMDALRMLEFPTGYFDLVNQRAGMGYLRTWDWRKLLQEYQRVTRGGGVIRVTEFDITPQSPSQALTQLCDLFIRALHQAGNLFVPESAGITSHLEHLLIQHGLQNVQTRACTLEYRAGTPQWRGLFDDVRLGFQNFLPFLEKWIRVPGDYQAIYQQALSDIQQPDFVATGSLLTAWGTVPRKRQQQPADSPR